MVETGEIIAHGALMATSAILSYLVTSRMIPVGARYLLTEYKLYGVDMGKKDKIRVPESLGIIVGLAYLAFFSLFFIISPFILVHYNILSYFSLSDKICISPYGDGANGYSNSLSNIAAITSIFAMLMLGFIDDLYDLRWRYKLMFPFAASIPLLSVYYYSYRDRTTIIVPQFLTKYLNLEGHLNLGIFYYIFMLMFVIFCTNAINIYAGINGLEAGQTIVLTVSVILYNIVEISTKSDCDEVHILSLQLLIPFLFCSCALYRFNRYPAKVFVGDSYCYFAGMTLAVVGILGHFSEEILIFAAPQVFNFILSVPQLFKIVPCPRHRLPKFNETTGLREPSTFTFRYSKLNLLGKIIMRVYSMIGFARLKKICNEKVTINNWRPRQDGDDTSDQEMVRNLLENSGTPSSQIMNEESAGQPPDERSQRPSLPEEFDDEFISNNLTLINLWLCWFGPMEERTLCHKLLRFQCCLSFLGLAVLTIIKIDGQ